jgi:hypothetical protein
MSSTSVILVSVETLPNVLFIREFPAEQYVFITTQKMEEEKRSHWIIRAAGIQESQVQRIEVNQDDFRQTLQALEKANLQPAANWKVNITGGNKLMSIAAFNFFARYNAAIFYLAIDNKHFQQLFPNNDLHPIRHQVHLTEYLAAHGRTFQVSEKMQLEPSPQTIMNECRKANGIIGDCQYLVKKIAMCTNGQRKQFLTGTWFEIYVYESIKTHLQLPDNQIALGAALYPLESLPETHRTDNKDNDIDVCFTYKNYLYLMECKVYHGQKVHQETGEVSGANNIQRHLYKLAAIKQSLGLNAKAYLITPNNLQANQLSFEGIQKRCEILRIGKPIDFTQLQTEETFQSFLSHV